MGGRRVGQRASFMVRTYSGAQLQHGGCILSISSLAYRFSYLGYLLSSPVPISLCFVILNRDRSFLLVEMNELPRFPPARAAAF